MCTPIPQFPSWGPAQSYPAAFLKMPREPHCSDPIWSPLADGELMSQTLALLERRYIIGVVSGTVGDVAAWRKAAPDRLIPGVVFEVANDPALTPDSLRRLHAAGRLAVLGEVTSQYSGIAPADE